MFVKGVQSDSKEHGTVWSSGPEATHVASHSSVSGDEAHESQDAQWRASPGLSVILVKHEVLFFLDPQHCPKPGKPKNDIVL